MVKRIKSSALLRGSTSNNCSTVYQKELSLLLIQASPTHCLLFFATDPGDLLDSIKKAVVKKVIQN